jgi:hypothetical protein
MTRWLVIKFCPSEAEALTISLQRWALGTVFLSDIPLS